MGNALVDIMTKLHNDKPLTQFNLPKGSMTLVDEDLSTTVRQATADLPSELTAGGSACNTIDGLARLGIETAFIGAVSGDDYGTFYKSDLEKNNIVPLLFHSTKPTGRAVALVTPDSERTFATHLGAAVDIPLDKITPELFKGYDVFHVEGYLVYNHALIQKAVEAASEAGLLISIDMASFNVVDDNLDFLQNIVNKYVDICFANEEEARSFTGYEPEQALDAIASMCTWAIVKVGEKGSMIKYNHEVSQVGIIEANCIDTTGAGDLYASGFLYGLANDWPMEKCGMAGAMLSGKVIEMFGSRMKPAVWEEIHREISKL